MPRFSSTWLLVLIVASRLAQFAAAQTVGQKYCLCVGVQDYAHEKLREPPLKYAVADAAELAIALKRAGYGGVLLTDLTGKTDPTRAPTKANIEQHLTALAKKCQRADTLLVAFAGHGLQFAGEKDAYFCPQDARPFKDKMDSLVSIAKV